VLAIIHQQKNHVRLFANLQDGVIPHLEIAAVKRKKK